MKKLSIFVFIFSLFFLAVGCSNREVRGDKPKIAVVLKTISSPYWKFMEAGAKQAFKDFDVTGIVVGPTSEFQVIEQINILESVLNQGPNVLVAAPIQPSTVIPVFKRYKEVSIPVLLIDTDVNWPDRTTYIGTNNVTAGKTGGKALVKMLKKGDKVALIAGALGNSATDERIKGAKAALTREGINVVSEQSADSDKAKAMSVMENILQTFPDVKGVFAANDDMALGALRAIEEKNVDVKVIGVDGTVEAIQSIISGKLTGSVAQNPYVMGYKAIENALKVIQGKKINKWIDSGVDMITMENAQKKLSFLKRISK